MNVQHCLHGDSVVPVSWKIIDCVDCFHCLTVHSVDYLITHTNACTYIYILFKKSRTAQLSTHNRNQAHSEQRTTHTKTQRAATAAKLT